MEFRKIKIANLIPASYNPRKKLKKGDREYEKIRNSITEFGYVEPVIVNSDMTIVAGHQRATVLTDLGYEEIDCIVIDIDKRKEKALNIALNKITGEWNKELLADLIADLQDSDFDVTFTGFEPPEIEQLFNSVHDKKVSEDDFDIDAELEKPAVAKMGDVWTLGRHRLVVGDSTLPETYDVLMAGAKANLVVTDPPYNVDYEGSAGKIRNDHMENEQFYNFLFAAFVNMEQHMEGDASIYVFHADTEGLNFRKAFQAAGFYLSGCCMGNAGIKSTQAGTALRTIMSNLSGEVKICGSSIGEVTIATTNADGSMRDLSAILADCRTAFGGLSESEKAAAAEALVGKNAMSGFLALMNAAPADIEKVSSAIANCDGKSAEMAATMQDNLAGQLTILKSQLEELAISFGEILMPAIRQIVTWVQGFVDKLNGMDEGTKNFPFRGM